MSRIKGFIAYGRSIDERTREFVAQADEKAREISVETSDMAETISLEVSGDLKLKSLHFDEDAYGDHDEDTLADAIMEAYDTAIAEISRAQYRSVFMHRQGSESQ
ncbi:MAG: YbaB/EbfC family nucleoid-associated protein [Nitrososphaeraceae archaeon]